MSSFPEEMFDNRVSDKTALTFFILEDSDRLMVWDAQAVRAVKDRPAHIGGAVGWLRGVLAIDVLLTVVTVLLVSEFELEMLHLVRANGGYIGEFALMFSQEGEVTGNQCPCWAVGEFLNALV